MCLGFHFDVPRCQPLICSESLTNPTSTDNLEFTDATPSGSGSSKALLAVCGSDLEVMSIVTTDDFWDGAYRMEREKRLKLEKALEESRNLQKVSILFN